MAPSGWIRGARRGMRSTTSDARRQKQRITSAGPSPVTLTSPSGGSLTRQARGAPTTASRCPGFSPSFLACGVPEYPASAMRRG